MNNEYDLFLTEEGIIYYKAGDTHRAYQYWLKAAELGNISAMFNIGVFFLQNITCRNDLLIARNWFTKAKNHGHKNAMKQISKIDLLLKENKIPSKVEIDTTESNLQFYKKINFGGYSFLILYENQKEVLCLSEYLIDVLPYHNKKEKITWEHCDLRKWLNTKFLSSFSISEYNTISEKEIINDNNPIYFTNGGANTVDKIFLLSYSEIKTFMSLNSNPLATELDLMDIYEDDIYRKAFLNLNYNEKCIDTFKHDYSLINGKSLGWWLRTPGDILSKTMRVNCNGTIRVYGRDVDRNLVGVRPAMWLNKKELKYV